MVLIENDAFLSELTRMFQKSRTIGAGTVSIVMKKYDGRNKPIPKDPKVVKGKKKPQHSKDKEKEKGRVQEGLSDHSCLMRAKLHNKKISTLVHSKDVNRFQMAYCSLLKGNMDNLKKMKKLKSKTTKTTS